MNEKSSEYYQAAEQSVHVFFLWLLEKVSEGMKKRKLKFGYCSFLTSMLQDLEVIAPASKAKRIDIFKDIVPLSGITFTHNDAPARMGCNDVMYRFDSLSNKPVYLGTLTMINSSPQTGISQSAISFVLADSEEDAMLAISNYYQTRRDLCRQRCQISSLSGDALDDFPQTKWSDLALPPATAREIETEVRDFFKAESHYEVHGIKYRRGLLFAGPRGNGKTMACQAIASCAGVPVLCGNAFQMTAEELGFLLPRAIGYNSPCIVIVEDLDLIFSPSEEAETMVALLSMMDKIALMEGVMMIGTINSEHIEPGFFRPGLFDATYFFPNPASEERKRMLCRMLGKCWKSFSKQEKEELVTRLEGCSGAVIQEVVSRAILGNGSPTKKEVMASADEVLAAFGQSSGNSIGY